MTALSSQNRALERIDKIMPCFYTQRGDKQETCPTLFYSEETTQATATDHA